MSNENDKVLDHEYDGIQELDNNLPTWWLWTFFLTIIFGFIYWLHYDVSGDGPTLDEELNQQMAQIQMDRKRAENSGGDSGGQEMSEKDWLVAGATVYRNYCAACHREDGGGTIGPNLTDSFWIHGTGEGDDLKNVILNGVLAKGMPAWKESLKPKDVKAVVAFVTSLRNTNVGSGKAPQGAEVK